MEQMKVAEERIIQLNYEDEKLSLGVRELRPVVFEGGGGYFCVLGPSVERGITGSGTTIENALIEWEAALEKRIQKRDDDDEVALYAADVLQASNRKVW